MKPGQPERQGPLAGHRRQGRRYLPDLIANVGIEVQDWVRDDLPDLLWPVLVLADAGDTAARRFVQWQRDVHLEMQDDLSPAQLSEGLDGRLTGLDRLVEQHPGAAEIITRWAVEHRLLPDPVVSALSTYPRRPGQVLVAANLRPPEQADIDFLVKAVREAMTQGHRESLVKCISIWSAVQTGAFSSDAKTIELLQPYPNDPATLGRADSAIRAMWNATRGARLMNDPTRFDDSIHWAKVFWGVNTITTPCVRRSEREAADPTDTMDYLEEDADVSAPSEGEPAADDGGNLQDVAEDLVASYIEALERAPHHLYEQERQEVHAGLVSRAGREAITVLGCPDLWCAEHGSHLTRILVEVRILLQWMSTQEADIYRRYQDFGRGKAKLYRRILDEIPIDDRMPGFSGSMDELDRLSHNHDVLDLRVVDTADSFSGKSLRAMAEDCGLLDLYRHTYYLSSGVAHSEWWSVETHAMERCLNVLHRVHMIPSMSLNPGRNVPLAKAWLDQLHSLILVSLGILGTDQAIVHDAFRWLEDDSDDTSATDA